MGVVTLRYYYVFTIPTSPAMTLVSPRGAAGQQTTIRQYHMGVVTFRYNYVFTIPTSPDSGLTSRCGWTAKANPPYEVLGQGHGKGQWVDAHSNYPT